MFFATFIKKVFGSKDNFENFLLYYCSNCKRFLIKKKGYVLCPHLGDCVKNGTPSKQFILLHKEQKIFKCKSFKMRK